MWLPAEAQRQHCRGPHHLVIASGGVHKGGSEAAFTVAVVGAVAATELLQDLLGLVRRHQFNKIALILLNGRLETSG